MGECVPPPVFCHGNVICNGSVDVEKQLFTINSPLSNRVTELGFSNVVPQARPFFFLTRRSPPPMQQHRVLLFRSYCVEI